MLGLDIQMGIKQMAFSKKNSYYFMHEQYNNVIKNKDFAAAQYFTDTKPNILEVSLVCWELNLAPLVTFAILRKKPRLLGEILRSDPPCCHLLEQLEMPTVMAIANDAVQQTRMITELV